MQNRIDRLEGLVLSLMTNGTESAGPAAANRALSRSASSDSPDFQSHHSSRGDGDDDEMNKDDEMSETEEMAKSLGVLKVMDNKSFYIGDTHWAAILNDVCIPIVQGYGLSLIFIRYQKCEIGLQSTRSSTMSRLSRLKRSRRTMALLKDQLSYSGEGVFQNTQSYWQRFLAKRPWTRSLHDILTTMILPFVGNSSGFNFAFY